MYCDGYTQMAKIKITCGGLQMKVGRLGSYMGGIKPNSPKPAADGANAPDGPESVAKKVKTTVGAAAVSAAEQAQAPPALTDLPVDVLNNICTNLSPVDAIHFSTTCNATRRLRELEKSKVKEINTEIETGKNAIRIFDSSKPCPSKWILKYRPFAKDKLKDRLDDYIQDYINTKLPKEKKALFDKLREEPGSTEKAKTDHTTAVTAMITDHPLLVFATDEDGDTPLHCAARWGMTDLAKLLLANWAEVNAKDEDGWTPLHWAAEYGKLETVQALLDAGANPDTKNNAGYTPLHWAAIKGDLGTVKALIDNGADVTATVPYGPSRGDTPLDVATNDAIKALLLQAQIQSLQAQLQ